MEGAIWFVEQVEDGAERRVKGRKCVIVYNLLKAGTCGGSDEELRAQSSVVVCEDTAFSFWLPVEDVMEVVQLVTTPFWEDALYDVKGYYHLVGSSDMEEEAMECGTLDVVDVCPASESPLSRYGFASLCFQGSSMVFEMITTNVICVFEDWLKHKCSWKTAGTINAIAVKMIPRAWMYWAMGRWFFQLFPEKAKYIQHARTHEVSGSTLDFKNFFGRDVGDEKPFFNNTAAIKVVTKDGIPAITFRMRGCTIGTLLIIVAGVQKLGPVTMNKTGLGNCGGVGGTCAGMTVQGRPSKDGTIPVQCREGGWNTLDNDKETLRNLKRRTA